MATVPSGAIIFVEAICPMHNTLCANAFGIPIFQAEDNTSLLANQFP